jgi:predicted MFS family arabinose efflux permease
MMGVFNMSMSVGILFGSLAGGIAVDTLGLKYAFPIIAAVLAGTTFVSAAMIRSPSQVTPQAVPADSLAGSKG